MDTDQLKAILEEHKKWIASSRKEGKRANLSGANLREADLSGAILSGANLSKANLSKANLSGAILYGANLIEANLSGAILMKAILSGAILSGAILIEANLSGAILMKANLIEANLSGAILMKANLSGANLRGANLSKANLILATLSGATLVRAILYGANLIEANLSDARIINVRFNRRARYRGIKLDGCHGSPRFKRFAQDQEYIEDFRVNRRSWRFWLFYLPWLIFADCGRSMLLWTAWSAAISIGFGYKYYFLGKSAFLIANKHTGTVVHSLGFSLETMIYYSVVIFTTLGFGDLTPLTHEAAHWVMAEVITGYIMLGGLISIFFNKLARRA